MLSVEDWAEIRRLYRAEGMPVKVIARVMGVSRNTVRATGGESRWIATAAPVAARRSKRPVTRSKPALDLGGAEGI